MKHEKIYNCLEFLEKFKTICEECENFDMDMSECKKSHKPRRYIVEDGPNEYLSAKKNCKSFEQYSQSRDDIIRTFKNIMNNFTSQGGSQWRV